MKNRVIITLATLFLTLPLLVSCSTYNAIPGVEFGAGITESGSVTTTVTVDPVGAGCAILASVSESWAERFCPALEVEVEEAVE